MPRALVTNNWRKLSKAARKECNPKSLSTSLSTCIGDVKHCNCVIGGGK
jgi:hypothetical protein